MEEILTKEQISVNRACKIVCMTRSMYYYSSKRDDDVVVEKLNELAEQYPTRGFVTYFGKIRLDGLILMKCW